MKNLADYLGFYFVMFQRDISDMWVKCWIDGSEDYEMMYKEDFYALFDKADNPKLLSEAKNALTETSIFLWNIEADTIVRLSASRAESHNIREELHQQTKDILVDQKANSPSQKIINNVLDTLENSFKKVISPFKN